MHAQQWRYLDSRELYILSSLTSINGGDIGIKANVFGSELITDIQEHKNLPLCRLSDFFENDQSTSSPEIREKMDNAWTNTIIYPLTQHISDEEILSSLITVEYDHRIFSSRRYKIKAKIKEIRKTNFPIVSPHDQ